MLSISDLKGMAGSIRGKSDGKPGAYYGTVTRVDPDGTTWVRFDGAESDTPCDAAMSCKPGDRVPVTVRDHRAMVGGNVTEPATGDAATRELSRTVRKEYVKTVNLETEAVKAGLLTANSAVIGDLSADTAKVHDLTADQLTASVGYIEDLTADSITAGDISAATGYIGDLMAGNVTAQNILADHAKVGTIDTAQINADHAVIADLDANYASIDLANVDTAYIDHGVIRAAAIVDEQVFTVTGNKATLAKLDASKINVFNLRAENLVVSKINGQPVLGEYEAVNENQSGYASKNPKALGWYEFSSGGFALSNDTTVDTAKAYFTKGTGTKLYDQAYIDSMEQSLNQRIDGAIETWTGTAVPTMVTYPVSEWSQSEYDSHVGDIYYVVNSASDQDGYCYRFAYDNTSQSYGWVLIKDTDVTKALQDITDLQEFESDTTSWITETDEGLTTIRQNHTNLAGVVDKTVKDTVQLWYTKANTTAPSKPTAKVTSTSTAGNAWRVVVPAWNASYPNYYFCYQMELADGTFAWSDVVRDIAMGESQGTSRDAQTKANADIQSSVQLWYTSNSTTPPAAPSAEVTSTATTANQWTTKVPTYASATPKYHYCYQQKKGDGTFQWTTPTYDDATTTAMAKAQAALPSSTFTTFQTTTFKELVDEVDEQGVRFDTMSEKVETIANPNLSPWFSMPKGDVYDASDNPGGYWHRVTENASITTYDMQQDHNGGPGWVHIAGNVSSGNPFVRFEPVLTELKPDTDYTFLLEIDGQTVDSTIKGIVWRITNGTAQTDTKDPFTGPSGIGTSTTVMPDGVYRIEVKTLSDTSASTALARAYVQVYGTGAFETWARLSLYESAYDEDGNPVVYSGPYKPYVVDNGKVVTLSNTVNDVRSTADANYAHLSQLTQTLGTNADGTTKADDIVHKYNDIDQDLDGLTTRVGKTEAKITGHYATSSTAAGTAAKAATITPANSDWELYTGATVTVKFSNANTAAAPTLNVNSEGAKSILGYTGAALTEAEYTWAAGAALSFTYNGSAWLLTDNGMNTRVSSAETSISQNAEAITLRATKTEVQQVRPAYATSSTAAGTAAKVATIDPAVTGYALYKGAAVAVTFSTANTAATPTLNVNSTGAKQIRSYTGAALSEAEYKWAAGSTIDLVYDGTYWRMQDGGSVKRVSAAEAELSVQADEISARVEKDGVIAAINASVESEGGSAVKISADKVNVEGAAIFTSGRLSTSSLNNAYDSKGSASTAEANAKSAAVGRTQRIYYRQTESGAKPAANTTWLATSGTGYGNWSLTVPQLTNGTTKYPKLYTAVQTQTVAQQAAGTACSCSAVLLDDSTTVIDGGNIITGSVSANSIDATSGTFDTANIPNLDAAKITSGYISSDRIASGSLAIGKVSGLQTSLDGKATIEYAENYADGLTLKSHNAANYAAYDFYVSEDLIADQPYVIKLWDVDVAHSGKEAAALGVWVYYCGGSVRFGFWEGTDCFTDGHADYLEMHFTPHLSRVSDTDCGTSAGNLSATTVTGATQKFIRLYNSVPDATGTKNLSVGSWRLEKDYNKTIEGIEAAAGNLLRGTASPVFNTTDSVPSNWKGGSEGDGTFSVETVTDSPVAGYTKSMRITGNTSGNRDWKQNVEALQNAWDGSAWADTTFTFSTYVRAIGDDCSALIRCWGNAANFSKTVTVTSGGWQYLEFPIRLTGAHTTSNEMMMFGITGAGTIEYIAPRLVLGDSASSVRAQYGTCDTAAATAAKVVVCEDFALYAGARIAVKFTNANTAAAPTLNVNGTGAKAVWNAGSVAAAANPVRWGAGATVNFVYDGTVWNVADTPPSYSATCSTAAATQAKAPSVAGALVVNGTTVTVRFSTANTYSAGAVQLNLSGTGAANVYVNNAATSATNTLLWDANTDLTFVRNMSGWFLVSRSDASETATNYITADSSGIKIHDAGDSSNYQHQTADGTAIYVAGNKRSATTSEGLEVFDSDGETSVAKFGSTTRVGTGDSGHIIIEDTEIGFFNDNAYLVGIRSYDNAGTVQFDANGRNRVSGGTSKDSSGNTGYLSITASGSTGDGHVFLRAYTANSSPASYIDLDSADGVTIQSYAGTGGTLSTLSITSAGLNYVKNDGGNGIFKSVSGQASFMSLEASDIPSLAASKITSGTLATARGGTGADGSSVAINRVLASPSSGSAGAVSYRALVAADLPTVTVAKGGTGKTSHTVNSVIVGGTTTTGALQNVAAASGALYSTGANVKPSFGTLPIAQGGTGQTGLDSATGTRDTTNTTGGAINCSKFGKVGFVRLQGLVAKSLSARSAIGTVPSGYYPAADWYGQINGVAGGFFIVSTDGTIYLDAAYSNATLYGAITYPIA